MTNGADGYPAWSNGLILLVVQPLYFSPGVKSPFGVSVRINPNSLTSGDLDYTDYENYDDIVDAKIPAWFEAWEKRIKSQIKKSWAMKFLAS